MLLELPDGKQFGRWYHFLGLPDGIVPAEKSAGLFFHRAALLIFKKFLKKMNFNLSNLLSLVTFGREELLKNTDYMVFLCKLVKLQYPVQDFIY